MIEQTADNLNADQVLEETLILLEIGNTATVRVSRRLLKQYRLEAKQVGEWMQFDNQKRITEVIPGLMAKYAKMMPSTYISYWDD